MAMFVNGVPTGMTLILQRLKPIPLVHQQVRTAFFVAAAGASMPSIAVQPFAAAPTTRATSTTTVSGFAWLSPRSSNELKVERFESRKFNLV